MRRSIGTVLVALGVLALALPATAATNAPPLDKTFIKSCQAQMGMSQAACTCLAGKAAQQLDAKAVAYLEIQANNGPAAAAAAKALTARETASIDRFMHTVPNQCSATR